MLEHMHTGVLPISVDTSTYDPEGTTLKLIDVLYELMGHNKEGLNQTTPELPEGYAYEDEDTAVSKKIDLSFCKGRK